MEDKHIYSTSFLSKLQDRVGEFAKEIQSIARGLVPKLAKKQPPTVSMQPLIKDVPRTPITTSVAEIKTDKPKIKKQKVKRVKKERVKKVHFRKFADERAQKILVIGLATAIISIFGFGVYQTYKDILYPEKALQESKRVPTKTSPNATTSWQTYRNDKFMFEFKYPNDWKSQTYLQESMVSIDPVSLITEEELITQNIPPGIISIQVNIESPDIETYCWKGLPYYTLLSSKTLNNQNGIPVKFVENYNIPEDQSEFYQNKYRLDYYFCSKNGTNAHAILVINQSEKNTYIPLFDQIISTITFNNK